MENKIKSKIAELELNINNLLEPYKIKRENVPVNSTDYKLLMIYNARIEVLEALLNNKKL